MCTGPGPCPLRYFTPADQQNLASERTRITAAASGILDVCALRAVRSAGTYPSQPDAQKLGLIGREHSLVNQLLAVGYAVIEIDAQGGDGCPANGSPAHKARAVPAEVIVPLMAPRIE